MRKIVGPKFGVKEAGGIRDAATALAMIGAGANRIGASSSIALLRDLHRKGTKSTKGRKE
jgi:deoxyribose-phosphate aldolase